jgi:hypothetical protein
VVIPLPFAGDLHALFMLAGIDACTGTPGYLAVPGWRPGQDVPALS